MEVRNDALWLTGPPFRVGSLVLPACPAQVCLPDCEASRQDWAWDHGRRASALSYSW
jgi:hypothetical protein